MPQNHIFYPNTSIRKKRSDTKIDNIQGMPSEMLDKCLRDDATHLDTI